MLAHETLQAEATAALGPKQLAAYRDQIHAWADTYQAQNWPPDTPVYLLRGYFRILQATHDTTRIIACATDPARHDRLLARSGGDTAALAEIGAAIDSALAQPRRDVATMTRLAYHRDKITNRNQHMPASLPAIWATLGSPTRAEALARSITDPDAQTRALAEVARALAEAGLHDQAQQVASQAEVTAHSISSPYMQAQALAAVARAMAEAGLHDQAQEITSQAEAAARFNTDPDARAWALAEAAQAWLRPGYMIRPRR